MNGDYDWIPMVSVGVVRLGDPVSKYLRNGVLVKSEFFDDDPNNPDYVDAEDNLSVVLDDDLSTIESLLVDKFVLFKGQNLIGMSKEELIKHLDSDPVDTELEHNVVDDVEEEILHFDNYGLMVWIRNDRVRVVAVGDGNDD